jgi:hypothetical protein
VWQWAWDVLDTCHQEAQQHIKHQLFYTIITKKWEFFTIIVTKNKRIGFLEVGY